MLLSPGHPLEYAEKRRPLSMQLFSDIAAVLKLECNISEQELSRMRICDKHRKQAYRGSLERKSSQSVHSQEAKACPDLFYERIKTDTPKKTSTILQNVHLHRVDREYFVGPMTPIFINFLAESTLPPAGFCPSGSIIPPFRRMCTPSTGSAARFFR